MVRFCSANSKLRLSSHLPWWIHASYHLLIQVDVSTKQMALLRDPCVFNQCAPTFTAGAAPLLEGAAHTCAKSDQYFLSGPPNLVSRMTYGGIHMYMYTRKCNGTSVAGRKVCPSPEGVDCGICTDCLHACVAPQVPPSGLWPTSA